MQHDEYHDVGPDEIDDAPTPGRARGRARLQQHRGGTILTLGILGIVICVICGIFAWVMGNEDLKKMREGRMDRSGEGTTQAGRVCGIISVVLWAVFLVIRLGMGA
jgi:hypothetical protein